MVSMTCPEDLSILSQAIGRYFHNAFVDIFQNDVSMCFQITGIMKMSDLQLISFVSLKCFEVPWKLGFGMCSKGAMVRSCDVVVCVCSVGVRLVCVRKRSAFVWETLPSRWHVLSIWLVGIV